MGLTSSRYVAIQEHCDQEEEVANSKGKHETQTLRNSNEAGQTPSRNQSSRNGNWLTKRGLSESWHLFKQGIPAFCESKEREFCEPVRSLLRTRTFQANAYFFSKLLRVHPSETERGLHTLQKVQALLKSYKSSVDAMKMDDLSSIEHMHRPHGEGTGSKSLTSANYYSSRIKFSGTLPPCTGQEEGLPSFHKHDGNCYCGKSGNGKCIVELCGCYYTAHSAGFCRFVLTKRGEQLINENGLTFQDTLRRATLQEHLTVYNGNVGNRLVPCNNRSAVLDRSIDPIVVPDDEEGHMPNKNRCLTLCERRHWFKSQVWGLQRLSSSIDGIPGHTMPIRRKVRLAFLQHGPPQHDEETDVMASISRIIMLADALLQVVDDIHRQSIDLSLLERFPLCPPRAPHRIVESMPIKFFQRLYNFTNREETALQCRICLIDYEEGDCLRVLPCSHEYHKTCIDKWLREVHRVCPLCRRDICDFGAGES